MKARKIPTRTCVITNEKYPKMELIRIVRTPEGIVEVDISGKKNGRGAYIKKDLEVIEKAKKNKRLEKHLECSVPEGIYEELANIISNRS